MTIPLSPIAQLITDECCGALLGVEGKQEVLDYITHLEQALEEAQEEVDVLKAMLIDKSKEAFLAVYQGEHPEQAWQQLAIHLGVI